MSYVIDRSTFNSPGYPDYLNRTERQIIDRLIRNALRDNLCISVYDGEEYSVKRSTDYAEITSNVAATDMTTLLFRNPISKELVGTIMLVHGNDEDVISDCSDNPIILDMCDRANKGH